MNYWIGCTKEQVESLANEIENQIRLYHIEKGYSYIEGDAKIEDDEYGTIHAYFEFNANSRGKKLKVVKVCLCFLDRYGDDDMIIDDDASSEIEYFFEHKD